METFDYDDIQLIPNKCVIKSRKEADPQVKFGPKTFKIPVVPANMASVINEELAVWLAQNDYYYVMHRFNPADRAGFVKRMHDRGLFASISVGIKDSEYDFINQLKDEQLVPEYITIDVAHGHSDFVIAMIKHIKQQLPTTFLTAGNVATPEAVRDLENAGATPPRSEWAPVRLASPSSRPVSGPGAGNSPPCACVPRPPASH